MAAAVALLLCAGPARAAVPVTLGTPGTASGGIPDIAIDASGRAHVVWYDYTGTPDVTRYCQLPRGGAGCVNSEAFGPAPGQSSFTGSQPHVFLPGPGRVVVLDTRDFDYGVRQSTNGGLSFGPLIEIGDMGSGSTPDEVVFGPGESVTAISEVTTGGARVQNARLAGPFQEQWASLDSGGMMVDGAVGLHDGKPVVVYTDQSGFDDTELSSRMYDGDGPINLASNWTNEVVIEENEEFAPDHVSLAGGPRGLFLLYKLVRPGNDMFVVRKFTGAAFGPAIKVSDTASLNGGDLTQDGSGRLHAVWDTNNTNDLRWTFSDDGINWSPPVTIDAADSAHQYLRVAAAPDHGGFAVWKAAGGFLRAIPLEPLPTVVGPRPGPARDTVAPAASGLSISDSTLMPGQGATFRFRASEAGRAQLALDRALPGLKLKAKGKRKPSCFAETKKRLAGLRKQLAKRSDVKRLGGKQRAKKLAALVKQRRCTPWKQVTTLSRGIQAGVNSIFFSGKVNGRALKAGRYRAVLIVADAAGNVSRKQVTEFRVLAPKKKKRGSR